MPSQVKTKNLIVALAIFIIFLGSIIGTATYVSSRDHKSLPPVKSHSDILKQPMQSFADSLETSAPADATAYPKNSCPALSTNWVADENAKTGDAMTVKDWKILNLEGAQGSALWLNKTSGNCGDTVNIHASLYLSLIHISEPTRPY